MSIQTPTNSHPTDEETGVSVTPTLEADSYSNSRDSATESDGLVDRVNADDFTGYNMVAGDIQSAIKPGGVLSKALNLGGTNQYIKKTTPSYGADTKSGGRGISIWVYIDTNPGSGNSIVFRVRDHSTSTYNGFWSINISFSTGNPRLRLQRRVENGETFSPANVVDGSTNFSTSGWYLITIATSGTGHYFWINSATEIVNNTSASGDWWGDCGLDAGGNTPVEAAMGADPVALSTFSDFHIAGVYYWNKKPSNTEVAELYNSGVPTEPTGLSFAANLDGYWPLGLELEHVASQWQVSDTSGDYGSPVYDSGEDTSNLESITIPGSTLSEGTTYYWRVRYKDEEGDWSSWSTETEFTTESTGGTVDITKGLAYAVLTQTDITKGLAYEIARPIEELVDNFNDNTLDTGLWEEYNDPAIGDVHEEAGVQNFSLGNETEGRFGIRSIKRYTLEGSVISVQGVLAGSTDGALNQYPLYLARDENNAIFFKQNGKTLYAVKRVAGVETTIARETNDIAHYLRIRESGGTIYFERTDDYFGSWTELGTESTPIDITALIVDLSLEGVSGGPTNPEIMKLDNVNTAEQTVGITKGLAYAVKSTSDITKSLAYAVKTTSAITKGLAYEVVSSIDVTKNLSYAVRSQVDINKDLAYLVESSQEVTKSLAYAVLSNTDINKTLAYKVRSQTDITKGMAYEIANATQITKSLSYAVLTQNEITKGLGYAIRTEAQITKDLAYKVKTTNEVTKGMAYVVETPASSVDITKSLSYAVRSNTDITKTLAYLVKTETQVQLGLAYEITLNVCPYPGIAIAPYTEADSPYSAASEIYTPRC